MSKIGFEPGKVSPGIIREPDASNEDVGHVTAGYSCCVPNWSGFLATLPAALRMAGSEGARRNDHASSSNGVEQRVVPCALLVGQFRITSSIATF